MFCVRYDKTLYLLLYCSIFVIQFLVAFPIGSFFKKNSNVDYAVGAPNQYNANGENPTVSGVVYLCENCFDEAEYKMKGKGMKTMILNGTQYGERFGQTIIAIDIDGDGDDDIVVGAPLHAEKVVSMFDACGIL